MPFPKLFIPNFAECLLGRCGGDWKPKMRVSTAGRRCAFRVNGASGAAVLHKICRSIFVCKVVSEGVQCAETLVLVH